MMREVTVACVYRSGTFRDRCYSPDWVKRLRHMVGRNLSIPHRFVCLSNESFKLPHVEVVPLMHDWPGWWSKIELFRPGLFAGRVIYLDLDVLVTGALDRLVTHPAPMVLLPAIIWKPKPKVVRRYQSSCMVWTAPEGSEIYGQFDPGVMESLRGDQDWIGKVKPHCATFDPELACKLDKCGHAGPPRGVRIVLAVGGRNAEAARRFQWARVAWR